MTESRVIAYRLGCHACGYDLRGLTRDRACPECGVPVMISMVVAAEAARLRQGQPAVPPPFPAEPPRDFAPATAASRFSRTALRFVHDSLTYAFLAAAQGQPDIDLDYQVTARDLSAAFLDYVDLHFGADAPEALHHWGLLRSEDLGEAVGVLVKARMLRETGGDDAASFRELFALAPATPGTPPSPEQ